MNETQREFKRQMKELEQAGKIVKKPSAYNVKFEEKNGIIGVLAVVFALYMLSTWIIPGGLINLPSYMATKDIRNYMQIAETVGLREYEIIEDIRSRIIDERPFTAVEMESVQDDINAIRSKLEGMKKLDQLTSIELEKLEQLQIIFLNAKEIPAFGNQIKAINDAIARSNELSQASTEALIAYLNTHRIKWTQNSDGRIEITYKAFKK